MQEAAMLKSLSLSVAALSLLAACNGKPLTFSGTPVQVKRAYADSFQDKPSDTSAISVVTEEHGELHTYTLTPCGEGHVCGARQGSLTKTPDHYVVSGAYAGRTFYVAAGGSGLIKRDGAFYPMAWN
jgi:hypothetical protein